MRILAKEEQGMIKALWMDNMLQQLVGGLHYVLIELIASQLAQDVVYPQYIGEFVERQPRTKITSC